MAGFAVGGLLDIVRDERMGRLAAAGDTEQLGATMRDLISAGSRSEGSAYAREVAVREYALEVQAGRYLSLYESLLRR